MEVHELENLAWFRELVQDIQTEVDKRSTHNRDMQPALEEEVKALEAQIQGWMLSLGKSDLPSAFRSKLEACVEEALVKKEDLLQQQVAQDFRENQTRTLVNAEQVVGQLSQLAELLGGENPSIGNLELSMHIERIDCFKDGKVVVRTCKLGALSGVIDKLKNPSTASACQATGLDPGRVVPRRRARLRVHDNSGDSHDLQARLEMAADVNRFAGLDAKWFCEDVLQVPDNTPWSDSHAVEVAQMKADLKLSNVQLSKHFKVSEPTIAKALRKAAAAKEAEHK